MAGLPSIIRNAFQDKVAHPVTGPHYYRWVFDPHDASVELGHDDEKPRHETEYLTDMDAKHNSETIKGYAYRIHGGWRITDWEHKPLDDEFIKKAVHNALREKENA